MPKLNIDKVQESLKTKFLGRSILFSEQVNSTNEWAKRLATYGAEEGTATIALTQTSGRGRLGRQWFSPAGGLWFSVILRPAIRAADAATLVFVAGLAVVKALKEEYCLKVEAKWPNDVLLNGRKVCGILTEMKTVGDVVDFVAVGVGVNVNLRVFPEELRETATSLITEMGRELDPNVLLRSLLERLETLYERFIAEGFSPILEEWKKSASFLGHHVEVLCPDEKLCGKALDVDQDGALVLRLINGTTRRLLVGELSVCRRHNSACN